MNLASINMYYNIFMKYLVIVLFIFGAFTSNAIAQELHEDLQGIWQAQVIEVLSVEPRVRSGVEDTVQTLSAQLLDGPQAGQVIEIKNDYLQLKPGQKFFVNYLVDIDGRIIYSVRDIDRRGPIYWLLGLFIAVVVAFGGRQGVRAIISLVGSFLAIIYILLPLLISGYSPIIVSSVVGGIILFCAIFFTHGFNKQSLVAFSGTFIGVVLTAVMAIIAVAGTDLTGFASEEAVYLNFTTDGIINFKGLLLGGIMIGVLGVLDDIAVTQVAVVAELKRIAKNLSPLEIFKRSIVVGREHVSALVNTLVLAYAGVSLPLLLWFSTSDASFTMIINEELFATEIVRTIVGSIGLILTVPITTLLAVYLLKEEDLKHSHLHFHSH